MTVKGMAASMIVDLAFVRSLHFFEGGLNASPGVRLLLVTLSLVIHCLLRGFLQRSWTVGLFKLPRIFMNLRGFHGYTPPHPVLATPKKLVIVSAQRVDQGQLGKLGDQSG